MAKFMAEYEMEDWIREELESTWQRLGAPQAKQELWDDYLRHHPGLGGSLEAALAKRDIVACWIVTHTPHPSPPIAVIDMGLAVDLLDASDAASMKAKLSDEIKKPFPIPAGQEI